MAQEKYYASSVNDPHDVGFVSIGKNICYDCKFNTHKPPHICLKFSLQECNKRNLNGKCEYRKKA